MTLAELIEEVYVLTNRPDLVAETASAVKAATLKAHQSDFYSKDIFETGIEFSAADYRQSLDFISLFSNFRAIKYVRVVSDETDEFGVPIDIVKIEELLDAYMCPRTNVAYIAGRVLEIKSAISFDKILVGAYCFPATSSTGYNSWVAEQYPYAIVYEAVRVIFKTIGLTDESNHYTALVAEQYQAMMQASIADVGY